LIVFESKPISTTFNSIPLENISAFNKNSAYIQGQLCIYLNNIYSALVDIAPTVQFVWNSTDVTNKFGYDLYNDIKIPDPTNVYCTTSTIVWSIRNKKYYQAKATGYVNFTTQDPLAPADFNDLGATPTPLYRTELNYPDGKKNTFFWEYKYITNRNVAFDEVINRRAINNRSITISNGMTFSNTGTITLNSVLSNSIYEEDKIKIVGTALNDGVYKILDISLTRLVITVDSLTDAETITTTAITFYAQTTFKWLDFGIDKVAIFNAICDDIELKVTNAISSSYYVDGFLIKHDSSLEFTTSSVFETKYFSIDTHTIYSPYLEFRWNDYTRSTSLTTATSDLVSISLSNNKGEFQEDSVNRFRVNVRDKFPARTFQTSSVYLNNKVLPTSSYYAVKDIKTEEFVIDFDTTYTKLSADATGNYFDLYMNGLQPERYYQVLIKSTINGSTIVFEDNNYFKVIR